MEGYYVGVDIGGTSAKVCMYSEKRGDIDKIWEVPTEKNPDEMVIINRILDSIREECGAYNIGIQDVLGIGIGIPGPVDEDGKVLKCANLGWDIVNLKEIVSSRAGIDNVRVGNDANIAALGEFWRGSAKEYNSIVMVTLGTGVGGGIIINGKIHSGYAGAAGEIGHMIVEPDEKERCGCGARGCLEQYASARGVVRLAGMHYPDMYGGSVTAKDIFDDAKADVREACAVVDIFARYLGIALAGVAKVVSPEAFVIGGGVSAAGSIITDNVKKYYKEYSLFALRDVPIELAVLGNKAGMYGAVNLAAED